MVILADISVAPTNFPLKRLYRAAQTPFRKQKLKGIMIADDQKAIGSMRRNKCEVRDSSSIGESYGLITRRFRVQVSGVPESCFLTVCLL